MTQPKCLLTSLDNHTLTLTLNQPKKRNALSVEMLERLIEELSNANNNQEVRVIVIAANGSVFSAGHDLKELNQHRNDLDKGKAFFQQTMMLCSQVMQAIVNHPRPIIAKVQGMATAAGCQLVASCDLAIASVDANFCTPGVNIGLFCSTPMVALSRNVSRKKAMQMLLLGDVIDAQTAQNNGLINRAVQPDNLDEAIDQYCRRLSEKNTVTLTIGKEAFYQQAEMTLEQAYNFTSEVMVKNMLHSGAKEGINAFLEKRAPNWNQ